MYFLYLLSKILISILDYNYLKKWLILKLKNRNIISHMEEYPSFWHCFSQNRILVMCEYFRIRLDFDKSIDE